MLFTHYPSAPPHAHVPDVTKGQQDPNLAGVLFTVPWDSAFTPEFGAHRPAPFPLPSVSLL